MRRHSFSKGGLTNVESDTAVNTVTLAPVKCRYQHTNRWFSFKFKLLLLLLSLLILIYIFFSRERVHITLEWSSRSIFAKGRGGFRRSSLATSTLFPACYFRHRRRQFRFYFFFYFPDVEKYTLNNKNSACRGGSKKFENEISDNIL